MLYSSTRGNDNNIRFVQVMLNGLAKMEDYMFPTKYQKFQKRLQELKNLSYIDLAYEVTKDFVVSKDISREEYKLILRKLMEKIR